MKNRALFEQLQCQQQLLRVATNGFDVQTHVLAELLEHLAQIHAQRLHHHAQVLFVVELAEKTQAVVAIFGIGVVELLQELQLTDSGFVPEKYFISINTF